MVQRISSIDWRAAEEGFEHGTSSARLMREHLRRMAVWVRELQKAQPAAPFFDVAQSDRWPFFDLARYVEPSARPDSEPAAALGAFLSEHASSPLTGRTCRAALTWASLSPRSLAGFDGLPDPFEPLLLVFERSGAFWIENGFIDFVASRVRLGSWEDHVAAEPLLSLDGAALDAMDRA
ncbi:hypothetical protein SLAV_16910 [Streptomyces lavendulae subsp. lavendulae]|uniref:Uncharacterized protein n=1 Tax=Streptomyces lavendulae subsp. lavendulae TaxID=58340 RepID=A0A2K8PEQ6_STRLA|nr:hypothetical protein SLAV_16910 [Streptomyces lavendulae subsp. lavendulae]QUQ55062.1 hypothetical protein SLLC_14975 [Streptomyces lavendulae subsp. lavendulae]